MNHWVELVISDAVDEVSGINHFYRQNDTFRGTVTPNHRCWDSRCVVQVLSCQCNLGCMANHDHQPDY